MTLTIQIEDKIRRSLENMATENGKKLDQLVADIIDDYMSRRCSESRDVRGFMRLSETAFSEWNNEEDAIYDRI